jgi:hypothetical protein
MRRRKDDQVLEVVGKGFVVRWRGQEVRSVGGAIHYFPSEKDAWTFLRLCDAVDGMPAIAAELSTR